MTNKLFFCLTLLAFLLLVSCTSARWTVKDEAAADPVDYKIVDRELFLAPVGTVSPEDPTMRMELRSRTEYEYAQKVLVQRNIQNYRLRPGFIALGLTGSAIAFYATNSIYGSQSLSATQSLTLNAAGGLMALAGLLNMKPVGQPRPTGEEQYLRQTGKEIQVDSVNIEGTTDEVATVEIAYQDSVIFHESGREIITGQLQVPLDGELSRLQLKGDDPGFIGLKVTFNDSTYRREYPVDTILQPYAQVRSQLTELRNSPEESQDNILAELLQGSQVQIQGRESDRWYRVLYGGITDNYILEEDAEIIWRSSDFNQNDRVVTVPQIPFGDVDVESNIPVLRDSTENGLAVIITNENYSADGFSQRNYAHRDGRLIRTYLQTALGYPADQIHELSDVSSSNRIYRKLSELRFAATDSTELFVYLSGYGFVNRSNDEASLQFLNVVDDQDPASDAALDLRTFLEQLNTLPSSQTVVVGDIDFSRGINDINLTPREEQQVYESYTSELENTNKQTSFFWGMQLNQPSGIYVSAKGEDKKHRIFPYYFAKALQHRLTAVSSIYQYLQRNVSYTSRRLHDRSQDPILMGDVFLNLVSD